MPNTTTPPATDDILPAVDYPEPDATDNNEVVKAKPAADIRVSSGGRASSTFWAISDRTGRGTNIFNIGWPGVEINSMSQIAVSICERGDNGLFIGSAHMQILQVAPQNDATVFVRYVVAWNGDPLPIRFNFIIVN